MVVRMLVLLLLLLVKLRFLLVFLRDGCHLRKTISYKSSFSLHFSWLWLLLLLLLTGRRRET